MNDTGRIFAVITGDIIRSRDLDTAARKHLQRVLTSDISARLREAFPEALVLDMDVFRGDSWQLLIRTPHLALRIAFFCRAYMKAALEEKAIDSRMGIGLGTVAVMPRKRVSNGDGDAFRFSGSALDGMSKSRHLALAGSGPWDLRCLDVLAHLGDAVSGRWTDRQAIAVWGALQGMSQEEIRGLHLWGREKKNLLSQQAVAKHLKSGQWEAIQSALTFFEDVLLGSDPANT